MMDRAQKMAQEDQDKRESPHPVTEKN